MAETGVVNALEGSAGEFLRPPEMEKKTKQESLLRWRRGMARGGSGEIGGIGFSLLIYGKEKWRERERTGQKGGSAIWVEIKHQVQLFGVNGKYGAAPDQRNQGGGRRNIIERRASC